MRPRTFRLVDAIGCPYCARVRIVLAEKSIAHERVLVDLSERPEWLYALNPSGKVPVLETDDQPLPESTVIMEYLDELERRQPLLPKNIAARAEVRTWIWRHPERLSDAYYAFRRGEGTRGAFEDRLAEFADHLADKDYVAAGQYSLADIAYLPWILRAEALFNFALPPAVSRWVSRLAPRRAVAAEIEIVAGLARDPR
jgi:glutathione S-transferase